LSSVEFDELEKELKDLKEHLNLKTIELEQCRKLYAFMKYYK
jgi:hypothetical protein